MITENELSSKTPRSASVLREIIASNKVISLVAIIFLAEIVTMLILNVLDLPNYLVVSILDALIMTVLILPGLYYLQLKPLLNQIEERTLAQQALRSNEQLLSKVLELLPVGVGIIDQQGNLVHGNPAGHKIWAGIHYGGVEQYREYKGWWVESGKPVKLEEWAAARAFTQGETILNQEVEIESFDGTHKIILNSAVPILDEQEQVQGAIVINQDITGRKKIEQELRKSEEMFRTAVETLPVGIWLADSTGKILYGNPAGRNIWAGARYVGIDQFGEYKGWWLDSGKRIEPDEWAVARAIRYEETSINEQIEIECFDGSHKFIMNSAFPLFDEKKKISGAFIINQDITEQKLAADQLFRQNEELLRITASEQKQRQLAETLAQSILALNSSLELEHVMNTLLDHIHRIAPSDTAMGLVFRDEMLPKLQVVRGFEQWEGCAEHELIPLDRITDSLLRRLEESHKSIIIPNFELSMIRSGLRDCDPVRNWLIIPIISGEKMIGLVELGKAGPEEFDDEQILGAEALVSQATTVIQNAWLFEQVRSSGERLQALARKMVTLQENERSSIARELHDEAGQALSSLKISLSRLEQDSECPGHIKTRLSDLKVVTDEILEELHRLAMDLRPAALDHLGLVAALEQYTRNLNSEMLSIQFKAVGFEGQRLPNDVAIPLYRIVQEALTNVVRHAAASNVGVLLERAAGKVKIFIEDDGIGLQYDPIEQNQRMGLVGMRERAEMLGGSLTIESSAGEGTSIIVEVPDGYSSSDRR